MVFGARGDVFYSRLLIFAGGVVLCEAGQGGFPVAAFEIPARFRHGDHHLVKADEVLAVGEQGVLGSVDGPDR